MTDWREIAACFSEAFDSASLDHEALGYLAGLPVNKPVLVGCSGGADSLFLVLALMDLLEESPSRLHVLHFNHGLRDQASDGDQSFVEDLAQSLGLVLHSGKARSPVPRDEHGLRAVRYGWMQNIYEEVGAGALCLGQHADDLIESQLMALFSGSGPSGLAAPLPIKAFSDGHVRLRPLLAFKRLEIEKTLRSIGATWRVDTTNNDTSYTRNWIRHQLVPNLLVGFPQDIYSASAHTQTLMKESVEALDDFLDRLSLNLSNPMQVDLKPLRRHPRALVRRAIMAWWMRHHSGHRLETAVLEGVLHTCIPGEQGASWSIGNNFVLTLSKEGLLHLHPEHPVVPRDWSSVAFWHWPSGPLFLPDGSALKGEVVNLDSNKGLAYKKADPTREAFIADWDSVFLVRQWQKGDRYRPLGAPGRRKLQDLFTDAKLSAEQKRTLPVLLNRQEEIIWVPGFGPAEEARIQPQGKSALKLTYHRH